ncbi:bifunctional DNA primase/polymerase (plasmid) [Streptomyces decoyicus]|uniref:bifunctional DNA primase/polymerase n=1 Tax=Streptomyces decoyicus TaxID=249567 RepID=UPI002E19F6CE
MAEEPQLTSPRATELPTPRSSDSVDALSTRPPADVTKHQLAVALTWVARGIPVVPCSRTDKGALVPGFGKDAPADDIVKTFSDRETVTAWWSGRFKRAHVGLLGGRGPGGGLVVVDLDMLKMDTDAPTGRWAGCQGGTDVLEILAREAGADWPETYTVLTPSGGMHLYFRQPEGAPIGCATGDGPTAPHLGPLIDVRGVGGYVIAAGSYSAAQGRAYERITPAALGPQPLPGWLLELLRPDAPPAPRPRPPAAVRTLAPGSSRADRYADKALAGETAGVAGAAEGTRNGRLFAGARRLGELHHTAPSVLDESTVREQLLGAALAAGLRGGEREALRTIHSGWERGVRDGAGRGAGAA